MFALALAAVAVVQAVPYTPQERDLRCFAVVVVTMGKQSPEDQASLIPLATYYAGRVNGRDPSVDLERELRRLTADDAAARKMEELDGKRCAEEMSTVGQMFKQIGESMKKRPAAPAK